TLLKNGEALILIKSSQLYLTESFTRKEFPFSENIYTDIVIKGEEIKQNWKEGQVVYLKQNNRKTRIATNSVSDDFTKLINSSMKGYQNSKSRKGTFKIPTNYSKMFKEEEALQKHIQLLLKDFMDPEKDAVLPET